MIIPYLKRRISASLIKYIGVGLISVGVDYGLLIVLYRLVGLALDSATAIAFIAGLLVNFSLNRLWVFESKKDGKSTLLQVVLYGVLVLINTGFTVFVVTYSSDHLAIAPELSKPVCVAITTVWNYILYKKIIFRQSDSSSLV